MAISIDEDIMSVEIDGKIIATGRRQADGRWEVDGWPALFDRNSAITAMVLTERLAIGYDDDDPFVIGWRAELA